MARAILTDDQRKPAETSVQSIRARNRGDRRAEEVIRNIMDRLETFAQLSDSQQQTDEVRRQHAIRIVAAVLALSGEQHHG